MKNAVLWLIVGMMVPTSIAQQVPNTSSNLTVNGPVKTSGTCSPSLIQPQGKVTIECNVSGLSKEDADRLLRSGTEVLQAIRNSNLRTDQILLLLQQIAADTAAVRVAATDRHLTSDQRKAIANALLPFPNTYIVVEMSQGESATYGSDFIAAIHDAGIVVAPENTLFRMGSLDDPGVHLLINATDNASRTVPPGCIALNDTLRKLSIIDLPIGAPDSRVTRGKCLVYVGRKQ